MSDSRDNIFQSEDEGPADSYMGTEQAPEDKVRAPVSIRTLYSPFLVSICGCSLHSLSLTLSTIFARASVQLDLVPLPPTRHWSALSLERLHLRQ